MDSSTDQLRILPPELRDCIYSNLLFGDEEITVRIRQRRDNREGSRSGQDPSAVLAWHENPDPEYVANGKKPGCRWPTDVDEAFFQAICWTSIQFPCYRRRIEDRSRNEIISQLICELTGQERNRKTVSSHTCVLMQKLDRRGIETARCVDMKRASEVVKPRPAISFEDPPVLIDKCEIFRYLSTSASCPDGLSVQCKPNFTPNLLSLSSVNHLYRTEYLDHLISNMRFDFGSDGHALQRFCSTAPAEALAAIYHLSVTLVEGYMPQLPDLHLPNLRTLDIDLWPRNPTRPDLIDRAWGTQTEKLLADLGVVFAVRARIRLEMRWVADCERFEREYVEQGRWRGVVEADENCAPFQEEGLFRRACYELCGNASRAVGDGWLGEDISIAFRGLGI